MRALIDLFKLRIGIVIAWTALATVSMVQGAVLPTWQIVVLGLSVMISSAAAGAFNQYVEYDIDRVVAAVDVSGIPGRAWVVGHFDR